MMSVGMHARVLGQPGRIGGLRAFLDHIQGHRDVWVCRRGDLAAHFRAHVPPPRGDVMPLIAGAPDASAFAPFGTFIDVPVHVGERRMYSEWLSPVRGLSPQFHTNRIAASMLPLTSTGSSSIRTPHRRSCRCRSPAMW